MSEDRDAASISTEELDAIFRKATAEAAAIALSNGVDVVGLDEHGRIIVVKGTKQ